MSESTHRPRRKFLATGGSIATGIVAAASAPAVIASQGSKITIRLQTHLPAGSTFYSSVEDFASRVREASAGELDVQAHGPGTVVPTTGTLTALRRGLLDAAYTFPGYWLGQIPASAHMVCNLATFSSPTEMEVFMHEMGALEIIREAYAEHGVHVVGPIASGGVTLWGRKPIRTLEDLRGFKIRTNGPNAHVFQKMGAAPVSIGAGELYQALQTGVVDGAHFGSVAGGVSMGLHEVNSYIMTPDILVPSNCEILFSPGTWAKLGSDHKRLITDAVRATGGYYSARLFHMDHIGMRDFVEKQKGEVIRMEDAVMEEMRRRSMEVVDDLSKQDPKYSGKIGDILHEFMRLTGKA